MEFVTRLRLGIVATVGSRLPAPVRGTVSAVLARVDRPATAAGATQQPDEHAAGLPNRRRYNSCSEPAAARAGYLFGHIQPRRVAALARHRSSRIVESRWFARPSVNSVWDKVHAGAVVTGDLPDHIMADVPVRMRAQQARG